MRYKTIFFFLLTLSFFMVKGQQLSNPTAYHSFFLGSTKHGGSAVWQMAKADQIGTGGGLISSGSTKGKWQAAIVPGTVLTSLVFNKSLPDPYYGDVNRRTNKLIPDLFDTGSEFYHYWYRTTFTIPKTYTNKRIWIKLHGINYKGTVWLNGKKIGGMTGMFNSKSFDVTAAIKWSATNILAIDVNPVDVAGQSGPKREKRNGAAGENSNGGDGEIGKNVTMLMSVGWDFTLPDGVRDRNTGVWREVEVYATGDVTLESPFIYSKLPLPDTTSAKQSISVEVVNQTLKVQKGLLKAIIKETGTFVATPVTLKAGERKTVFFDPVKYPELVIKNPKLWWPVNKGKPDLYHLQLSFVQENQVTDQKNVRFGIREISSDQQTPDKSRRFLVNGHPIFIRGTNWIPEAMLRNDRKRTFTELQYTKQAGINLLRLWGGGIAESDYFYDRCDELGILVWNEYWLTGDTKFPTDSAVYLNNLENTVKRQRNHPSLAYYVSSNESTEFPGAAALIKSLDPTRGYQMQSECCGIHDGSPYKYENPMQYFENTASKRGNRVYGFNPEYGTLCLPIAESLKKMMPKKDLWPINTPVWDYMDGGGFHQVTTKYRQAVDEFGLSNNIDEFAQKAQFVGAMNYRAIWEVWNYNKFGYGDRYATGFLFWYHNSPVPQTSSRLYDWNLEPTSALYYSQNALKPLHAQFDYLKNTVSVYNDFRQSYVGYKVVAEIYDFNSNKVNTFAAMIDIPADGLVKDALKLVFADTLSQVHFIKLRLLNAKGEEVSDSFYWRSKDKYEGPWTLTGPAISGFKHMQNLPKAKLTTVAKLKGNALQITVTNHSNSLSFFTQFKIHHPDGSPIGGTFYTDNFFNLLPGETKNVTINVDRKNTKYGKFRLVVGGFNVDQQILNYTLK
jgi:mannosylglycoprotein endo-beta-mannosidase